MESIEIHRINNALQAEDDRFTASLTMPEHPVSFIMALPRCASTMFQQVVISVMEMGYVSNLMAQFWLAPCIGAQLDRKLRPDHYVSNFLSRFGNTVGVHEPHEWGWFWRHWLHLEGDEHYCDPDEVRDGDGLKRKLAGLERISGAPLLFDNVYAMSNLGIISQWLPSLTIVHLTRDPYFICNSILNARVERYGGLDHFYGHRPRDIDQLLGIIDPVEQVVLQVKSLLAEVSQTLATHPASQVFTTDYTDIVKDPLGIANNFSKFLEENGVTVRIKSEKPNFCLVNRNDITCIPSDRRDILDPVFASHFGDSAIPSS